MSSGELLAGRYQLDGIIGTGGMGEVHRAYDTFLGRYVALKLFPDTPDVIARRRFDNEIHLLAALSHPNLVTVYDAGTTGTVPFVALRLVDGPTLRDRIADAPLTVGEVRALGADIADALAHVHEHGVVHRDIKPSNILLDADGTPYLADFGLARLAGSSRLTRHDELVGTAAYLAPEQVRGAEIGPPADIYALGLVLLECLTGQREYDGSEIEAALARLNRPPFIPPGLPSDLTRLLSLMTSLTPRRRPSAADCAAALRGTGSVLPDDAVTTSVTTPAAAVPVANRRRTAKRVLTAAAIGALSLAGLSWANFGVPEPATSFPVETGGTPSPTGQPPTQQPAPPTAPAPQHAVVTHTSTVVVTAPARPPTPAANQGNTPQGDTARSGTPGESKGKGKKSPGDDGDKED